MQEPRPSRPSRRELLGSIYGQAWGLCVGYLGLGLLAELLRGAGWKPADAMAEFLDALPLAAMRFTGGLDTYVAALATGRLSPFWNRMLLSTLAQLLILTQATVVALFVLALDGLTRRARRHA